MESDNSDVGCLYYCNRNRGTLHICFVSHLVGLKMLKTLFSIAKYLSIFLFYGLIIFAFGLLCYTFVTSISFQEVLICGDDILSYDVIDGDSIRLVTENKTYDVYLYDDVIDFTINSEIYIQLEARYRRNWPWDEYEDTNYYTINTIIKLPTDMDSDTDE